MIRHGDNGDLQIFIAAGNRLNNNGPLYNRPDPPTLPTVQSVYRPSAAVFKFPPAFQLQLKPFSGSQPTRAFFRNIRILMVIAYFAACVLIANNVLKQQEISERSTALLFAAITAIIATSSDGLKLCIFLINYEIPIFFLLSIAFLLSRKKGIISGAIIGYLAATKIYPAYMATYFLATRDIKKLAAFLASIIFFCIAAYLVFGAQENSFYFREVFPTIMSEGVAQLYYNVSLGGMLAEVSGNLKAANTIFQILRLLFTIATAVILICNLPERSGERIEVFSILMVLMIISMPNYWQAYQVMLFPAFCIATKKVLMSPGITNSALLLLSIASMSIDINAWASTTQLPWMADGLVQPGSPVANIMEKSDQLGLHATIIALTPYYPLTGALYYLAKAKSIVPYFLWCILAQEIITMKDKQASAALSLHND
jgi:hypothetical protein